MKLEKGKANEQVLLFLGGLVGVMRRNHDAVCGGGLTSCFLGDGGGLGGASITSGSGMTSMIGSGSGST